jgi:hypothetical protein
MDFEGAHPGSAKSVWIYGSSRRFWVTLFGVMALASLILVVVTTVERGFVDLPILTVFLVVVLMCLLRVVRDGIELTAEGITVQKFGRRLIPWSDISQIDVRRVGGMRQARIVGHGQRIWNLPVPSDRWPLREKHFDEKLEVLRRHWKSRR